MRVGVLGTGVVGQALADKLAAKGHEVMIGTRDPEESKARMTSEYEWVQPFGEWHQGHPDIPVATFAEAAAHGEIVVNATNGQASIQALESAAAENLDGKILMDISNALDFSTGLPSLFVAVDDSLGEQIQRAFPNVRVVKTLNTVTARVMVEPGETGGGDHSMYVAGNDDGAKAEVTKLLTEEFGWRDVIDLGDLSAARGMEAYMLLWLRLMATGSPLFNVKVVR